MRWRGLVVVFVLTRLLSAWFATHPEVYTGSHAPAVANDLSSYEHWAGAVAAHGIDAYREATIEYPPAALSAVLLPAVAPLPYREAFIVLMMLVDAAGLAGLLVLAGRWGSDRGAWAWVLLLPLLGPVVHLRLDLVPAVATIWMVVMAVTGRWWEAGAWLGFGAAVKVYPALLLPVLALASPRRRAVLWGAGIAMAVPMLPFVGSWLRMTRSVAGYHLDRGLQLETLWSSGLLARGLGGDPVETLLRYGSMEVVGDAAPRLEAIGLAAVAAVVALGTVTAWRLLRAGDVPGITLTAATTLAGAVALGTVLSPQFLIWVVALLAAAACQPSASLRPALGLMGAAAVLTHTVYPFAYHALMAGAAPAVTLLVLRNLVLLGVAVAVGHALVTHIRAGRRAEPRAGVVETPSKTGTPSVIEAPSPPSALDVDLADLAGVPRST